MPIRPLAEIVIEHAFFAAGTLANADLVPTVATQTRLRGLRLVTKRRGDGLTIYAEIDAEGDARIAIPAATRLDFVLQALPASVALVTDDAPLTPGAVFTDDGIAAAARVMLALVHPAQRARETLAKPAGTATLVLSGRPKPGTAAAAFGVVAPAVGIRVTAFDPAANLVTVAGAAAADVTIDYPVAPTRAPGVLAFVSVSIGAEVVALAANGAPRRFVVRLQPRAARWCYHLVTDLPNPIAEWRIARAAGSNGGPAVGFSDAGRAELAAATADDPLGLNLLRRSAPLRVLRFVSDAPVVCSESVARGIGLFAKDRQLLAALPNPSPANVGRVAGQVTHGEVVRFVTT